MSAIKIKNIIHIKNAEDLVTPYANIRAGFVQMALERNARATPYVTEARDLSAKIKDVKNTNELTKISGINGALLTAAGISDKAAGHLDENGKSDAINQFIKNYLEPAGDKFAEELVYRFLLTRGDSLGGSMRNVVGILAQRRFSSMFMARFHNAGLAFKFELYSQPRKWHDSTENLAINSDEIKSFYWRGPKGNRVMSYNLKNPIVNKNIDMIIIDSSPESVSEAIKNPCSYVLLGELKGGIDPAGADEHWKTATSALKRIRDGFNNLNCKPGLFFIGAAIEDSMSKEIWNLIQSGDLSNAANLTKDEHVTSLCEWLISQ